MTGGDAATKPSQPPGSPAEAEIVEAVLALLVDAIWADVMGECDSDGRVPHGTEPKPEAPECTV